MDDEGWLDCDFDDDDVQFVCEKPAASQKKTKQTTSCKRKLISAAAISHAAAAKAAVSSSELWLYKYKPTTVKEVSCHTLVALHCYLIIGRDGEIKHVYYLRLDWYYGTHFVQQCADSRNTLIALIYHYDIFNKQRNNIE